MSGFILFGQSIYSTLTVSISGPILGGPSGKTSFQNKPGKYHVSSQPPGSMWYFPEVLLLHDPLGAEFISDILRLHALMNSIIYPFPSCPLPSLLLLKCLNNRAISTSYLIDGYGPYIFYQGNFYILIHNDFSRACLIVPYRQFPSECLKKYRIISALGAVSPYNRLSF